ncbi:unnamed protein product [Lymnaea stagnalis]|uniref:Tyrosine-protein phosphatase non-receptor type 23 n=1 Tax=Lymnaea stagnalis TaxID=6523 RepID=A0AAV2HNN9_LYMST
MEALPRLPMLSFELKHSPVYIEFGLTLKQYIRDHYGEDPALYNKACTDLEQLRLSAIEVSRDFTGCSTLKKYYAQLLYLQGRFPMAEGGEAAIAFTWEDVQTGRDHVIYDIKFEQACILYNIGSLHSLLGALDTRHNAEGMKVSCTHFQCAAWAFELLRNNYCSTSMSTDMSFELLNFHIYLMLAQAQECILEKSMIDNRKNSITAKVAAKVVEFYKDTCTLIDQADQKQQINSRMHKEWSKRLIMKSAFYQSITYYFLGRDAEEAEKPGECLAYYTAARDELNKAIQLAKHEVPEVQECLHFAKDVVMGKYESAKKDNDFVYHAKVPALDTLPEIKGASLVKGIPFNPTDKEISGPDIFQKLVPMEAHEASSVYSEEKAKLSRTVVGEIEQKNMELEQFMSSLQLDVEQFMPKPDIIPENLMEKCAAMSVRTNAIKELTDSMGAVSGLATEVELSLTETQQMIDEDNEKTEQFEKQYGKKNPSSVLPRLQEELAGFRKQHEEGSQLNNTLHRAMNTHTNNLKILVKPPSEVQSHLPPSQPALSPEEEVTVTEVRRLLQKVSEMKEQRKTLLEQFREKIHKDDITNVLVTQEVSDKDAVFKEQLKKHDQIVGYIKQNLIAQDNILRHLTDANAKFALIRQAFTESIARREKTVHDLILSYEKYEELLAKSQKGVDYYKNLLENVTRTLERCQSECKVRQEERDMLVTKLAPKAPAPSRPLAPKPGSADMPSPVIPDMGLGANPTFLPSDHDLASLPTASPPSIPYQSMPASFEGPKLKDFLPFMKPRSFGPKTTPGAPQESMPSSPSIAPAVAPYSYTDYSSTQNYPGLDPNLASVLPATIAQYLASVSSGSYSMAGGARHTPSPQHGSSHGSPNASYNNQSPTNHQFPQRNEGSSSVAPSLPPKHSNPAQQDPMGSQFQAGYPQQSLSGSYLQSGTAAAQNMNTLPQFNSASVAPAPSQQQQQQGHQQYGYLSGLVQPQQHPNSPRNDGMSVVSAAHQPIISPGMESMNRGAFPEQLPAGDKMQSLRHQLPGQLPSQQQLPSQPHTQKQLPGQPPNPHQLPGQLPSQQQMPGQPPSQQQMPGQPSSQQQASVGQLSQQQYGPAQTGPGQNILQQWPQPQFQMSNLPTGYPGPNHIAQGPGAGPREHGQSHQGNSSYGPQPPPGHAGLQSTNMQPYQFHSQTVQYGQPGMNPGFNPGQAHVSHHPGSYTGTPNQPIENVNQGFKQQMGGAFQQGGGASDPMVRQSNSPHQSPSRNMDHIPVTSVGYLYAKNKTQGPYTADFTYPNQQWYQPGTTVYLPSQYQGGYQHSIDLSYQHAQTSGGTFTSTALMYGQSGQPISTQSNGISSTQTTFSSPSLGPVSQLQNMGSQSQGLLPPLQSLGPQQPSQSSNQHQMSLQQGQIQNQMPQQLGQGQNQNQVAQFQGHTPTAQQHPGGYMPLPVVQGTLPPSQGTFQAPGTLQPAQSNFQAQIPRHPQPYPPAPVQNLSQPQVQPHVPQQFAQQHPQMIGSGQPQGAQPVVMQQAAVPPVQQQLPIGVYGPQPPLPIQGSSHPMPGTPTQPGMHSHMGPLPTPLQPNQMASAMRPGTPSQVPSRPQTPASQVSSNAPSTPSSPSANRMTVSRQSSSLDEILSSSPNGVKDKIITPQVLTDQERQLQKEEAIKNQALTPITEPYASPGALHKLLSDVEAFGKFVDELSVTILGVSRLDTVWKSLLDSQDVAIKKQSMAIARCYPMKNRDPDIMPYDDTRVVLATTKDDYINASWLNDLAPSCPKFITTQAPMTVTMGEFWAMVYEQGSEVLVQITSEYETGKKYPVYYPLEKDKNMEQGIMLLSLQSVKFRQHWVERIIYLKNSQTKQGRTLVHLQFKNWPVSGFPDDIGSIAHFISEVHNFYLQQRSLTKPIIVHCGFGTGRTGVFTLVYAAMQEILHGNGLIDVPGLARRMLQKRRGILHKKEQLKCCYETVLYFAEEFLEKRGMLVKDPHFSKKTVVRSSPKHQTHQGPAADDIVLGTVDLQTIQENVGRLRIHTNNPEPEKREVNMDTINQNLSKRSLESLSSISSLPDVVQQYADPPITGLGEKSGSSSCASNLSSLSLQNFQLDTGMHDVTGAGSQLHSQNDSKSCHPKQPVMDSTASLTGNNGTEETLGTAGSHATSLAQLQDPATFTMGSPDAKNRNKITKANFSQAQGSLKSGSADPSDPFGSLDPLWSLAKK